MSGVYDTRFRGREIVLSHADEIAFGALLVEAFPHVQFLDDISVLSKDQPPPRPVRSLAECRHTTVLIMLVPDWEPSWYSEEITRRPDIRGWHLDEIPNPNATFERGCKIRRYENEEGAPPGEPLEAIDGGRIYFRIDAGNREHEAVARKGLRLLSKVSSNRDLIEVRFPSLAVRSTDVRGGSWIGHDARRWCLEKANRCLGGMWQPGGAWAYRPKLT